MLASRWTRLAAGSDHANFTTNESSTTAVADAQSGFELERSDATSIRERASCGTAALTARRTDDSDGSGSQRMLDETTPSSHELPRLDRRHVDIKLSRPGVSLDAGDGKRIKILDRPVPDEARSDA
jgi:hypothetical protein